MEIKSIKKTDDYNLDFIEKQAKMVIEKDGKHRPLAILASKDSIFIYPMTLGDYKDKQAIQDILRVFVQKMRITEYWIIMESWVSCNLHIHNASRDINRMEALVISEFSTGKSINGKLLTIFFERDNKKIIWKERVVLDGEDKKGIFYSTWNFYKEDISVDDLREKARIADVVRRVEQADMSEEIKLLREMWKKEEGTDLELTDDEIKKQFFIKVIKDGNIGFENGIIPDKYKMDTDNDLKKRREK